MAAFRAIHALCVRFFRQKRCGIVHVLLCGMRSDLLSVLYVVIMVCRKNGWFADRNMFNKFVILMTCIKTKVKSYVSAHICTSAATHFLHRGERRCTQHLNNSNSFYHEDNAHFGPSLGSVLSHPQNGRAIPNRTVKAELHVLVKYGVAKPGLVGILVLPYPVRSSF